MRSITITTFSEKSPPESFNVNEDTLFSISPTTMRNPWRILALRKLTGMDEAVQASVMGCEKGKEWVNCKIYTMITYTHHIDHFFISCPNGRHRSVAAAEIIAKALREVGIEVKVEHLGLIPKPKKAKKIDSSGDK